MENRMEERLPKVVEERLQEAYGMIRKGEVKQVKKQNYSYRKWTSVAAVCAIVITASAGVAAAAAYFQKEAHQEADQVTYEFQLNYDLVPGNYKVTPGYLPDGYIDRGDGKYDAGDFKGISVLPIYTMAELDKLDGEIALADVKNVEHTTLSGMDADILTMGDGEYSSHTYIFLFNASEGYVLQIYADHSVGREELLKFADSLTIERTGDTVYETEEERMERKQEEERAEQAEVNAQKTQKALLAAGIPDDKIVGIGEELKTMDGAFGYTVMDYEFMDSIEGFDEEKFFEYSRFDGWLNEDKTLKPYPRQHYDADGKALEADEAEQEFLKIDMKVHCYDNSLFADVPLDFQLEYAEKNADGSYTWASDSYRAAPEAEYWLQMDNGAIYLDEAVHTEGEERRDYFFRNMENGEELAYTLIFVVDKDREDAFLLNPASGNYSVDQVESMTVQEIRDDLDGYIELKALAGQQ